MIGDFAHSAPSPSPGSWYCVHTRPMREAFVERFCREHLQIETFYPQLRQYRTIRRVRRLTTSALFPRYLFTRLDLGTSYRAIRYAPDVINLVHAGSAPAVVSDGLIDELRAWTGNDSHTIELQDSFKVGDPVRIMEGPLQGLAAVILRASDESDRVTILLSLLNAEAQLKVNRSSLERVAAVA